MKRQLLSIPVLIVTLILGVYIVPYDATGGIRGAVIAFVNALTSSSDYCSGTSHGLVPDVYGRYGDLERMGGPTLELARDRFTDVQQGRTYSYRVIGRAGNSVLLELFDTKAKARKYVNLDFSNPGWMAYFFYDSMDDYNYGRSSDSGSLTRISH